MAIQLFLILALVALYILFYYNPSDYEEYTFQVKSINPEDSTGVYMLGTGKDSEPFYLTDTLRNLNTILKEDN